LAFFGAENDVEMILRVAMWHVPPLLRPVTPKPRVPGTPAPGLDILSQWLPRPAGLG